MKSGLPQNLRPFIRMLERVSNQHATLIKGVKERDKSGTNKERNGMEPKR